MKHEFVDLLTGAVFETLEEAIESAKGDLADPDYWFEPNDYFDIRHRDNEEDGFRVVVLRDGTVMVPAVE